LVTMESETAPQSAPAETAIVEATPVDIVPVEAAPVAVDTAEAVPQARPAAGSNTGAPSTNGSQPGPAVSNNISMKALLEAGVHFGHQTKRWNPKMKPYIFTERNGIHIIDLQQTVTGLQAAMSYVSDLTSRGEKILFVGTKKQAQEAVQEEAERAGQPFVNKRWMGGMLTNFRTINERLRYLTGLESRKERGEFADLPKAEAGKLDEQIARLNNLLGGIKTMREVPSAIFIVDPHRERIAITEAIKLGMVVVAMVDTNCDPDEVDYVIPSNDDAIRAVRVITAKIADAAVEGQQRRESARAEQDFDYNVQPGEYSFSPDDEEEA
jgi:small subunit ribosomal protein S2